MFISDKQTIAELNLLGKYQPGSVYKLFNKVKTQGGERLLDNLFGNPLTEAKSINERSAVLRHFGQSGYIFPLGGELVSTFATWLDSAGSSTRVGAIFSAIKKKALSTVLRDERYLQQQTGISAAAKVLDTLCGFLHRMMLSKGDKCYKDRIKEVKGILDDKRLDKLRKLAKTSELSLKEMGYYDHLLKKTLATETQTILGFIYEIDVYIAVSDVAKERGFNYANAIANTASGVSTGNELKVVNLKHPCLEGAVGNDLSLGSDANLLFLTGANMAGKSTLMKSIGIALYLAHMGFPVAATTMGFSVRDGLYSSINVPDNISQGYSHFYAEVLRVKQAAGLVSEGRSMLIMFDELFQGTNVKDAFEGTLEVTRAFAKYTNCLFIISTHIIEVGKALANNRHILFGYMPTVMNGNKPLYTYKIKAGITEDRQGMLIIQNEGILELLETSQ